MKQLNEFIQQTESGLYFPSGDFFLDPQKPVKNAIISHAHNDHYTHGHGNIYCTPPTLDFFKQRYHSKYSAVTHLKSYHETFRLGNASITFISAGHMLGSAQVLVEIDGKKILYTGDFKLQNDKTCEPYEFVKADVLITESTFADPQIIHPDPIESIKKINSLGNKNMIIGTYVLGKAQRLNSLIEDNCPFKIMMLHHDIVPFHKIYQDHGVHLNNWIPYSRTLYKRKTNCIYMVPPVIYKYYYNQFKVTKAFASGWTKLQKNGDFPLLISDHADWNDLIKVIEFCEPTQIITLHGDGQHLKKKYEQSGIEVVMI